MKNNKMIFFGVLLAALLVSGTVVFAHTDSAENDKNDHPMMKGMMGTEMDNMHEQMEVMHEMMTQNLDPEMKEQMDRMHEACMGDHDKESEDEDSENSTHGIMGGMMG